jgi:uncharacterized protein YdcH (DUF465 family)
MHKTSFKLSTDSQIDRLQRRHSALKHQIATLADKRFLTVDEQEQVHELKKERLAAKDELVGLRQGRSSSARGERA